MKKKLLKAVEKVIKKKGVEKDEDRIIIVDLEADYKIKMTNGFNDKSLGELKASELKLVLHADNRFEMFIDDMLCGDGTFNPGDTVNIH